MHKRSRIALVSIALVLMLTTTGAGAVIVLNPAKDNSLIQVQAGSTELSNGLGDIFVGRTNQDGQAPATISIRRGLINFDIAANIPAGSTITDVSLTLWDVRGLNGAQTVGLHRVLTDWGQGTSFFNGGVGGPATDGDATWFSTFYNASDPLTSPAWTTPGGDFDPTVSGTALVTMHDSSVETPFTWTGAGMISDVQGWLDDPSTNFGWLIQGNEANGQTAKRFRGGEAAAEVRPALTVTYTAAVPEPSSIILLASGTVALLVIARRRVAR